MLCKKHLPNNLQSKSTIKEIVDYFRSVFQGLVVDKILKLNWYNIIVCQLIPTRNCCQFCTLQVICSLFDILYNINPKSTLEFYSNNFIPNK